MGRVSTATHSITITKTGEADLTETESLQIRFIFAGLVAVLGSSAVQDDPLIMSALSQTKIGAAAIETMRQMSQRQRAPEGEARDPH